MYVVSLVLDSITSFPLGYFNEQFGMIVTFVLTFLVLLFAWSHNIT